MFLTPTIYKEIINIVKCSVPKSTQGFNKISSKLGISTINQAANVLSIFFDKSFKQGIFPDNCKIARVAPLFKSGKVSNSKNYRPILILPPFSKILEKLIYIRLISFLSSNDVLLISMFSDKITILSQHALIYVLNFVTTELDKKRLVLSLFLGVSKAFDS